MTDRPRVTRRQRIELVRIGRHETPEFGVIINAHTATALCAKGLTVSARRRPFARVEGYCVRLTAAGREFVDA